MSSFLGTGALALWIDVAPKLKAETDYWYLAEHLPDRIYVGGYLRSRRYRAVQGSPQYFTLFEAKTPEDLASEGYLSLVKTISEQSKRIRAGFSNVARNTFMVKASVGAGMGVFMASFRLQHNANTDIDYGLASLCQIAEQASLLEGIVGCHVLLAAPEVRAKMDQHRVTGVQDAMVECALLIEATDQSDLDVFYQKVHLQETLSIAGWVVEQYAIYQLMYELSK
jgi:hypothetical protein